MDGMGQDPAPQCRVCVREAESSPVRKGSRKGPGFLMEAETVPGDLDYKETPLQPNLCQDIALEVCLQGCALKSARTSPLPSY